MKGLDDSVPNLLDVQVEVSPRPGVVPEPSNYNDKVFSPLGRRYFQKRIEVS